MTDAETNSSLRLMAWEGVASSVVFSLGSGGFMAAYALALGANNLQVGVLAALPFVTQVLQVPAILAVERFRTRKAIGVPALYAANLMWIPIGAVPFLMDTPGSAAVAVVIALMAIRGLFTPAWATASASWLRDLVPDRTLGRYYGRRLAITTAAVAAVGLGASFFVSWWEQASGPGEAILAFSFLLIAGSLTFGVAGASFALRAGEPLMPPAKEDRRSALEVLKEPLRDRNFSQLVRFLFVWSLTSNLAIPFFAIYMLTVLGLSLPVVIGLTVLAQATNVLFVRVWGRMADRVGSKTVLSLSASLYLLVIIGWVFTTYPERYFLTIPLLVVLHVFAGIASAGVMLTMSTIALKLAPAGKGTSFLGAAGIAANLGAGIGPIAGGVLADYFMTRSLVLKLEWISPGRSTEMPALSMTGFDFLFGIAFLLGLASLNLLVALREKGEVPREDALRLLAARAEPAARAVSSIPGIGGLSAFAYGQFRRVPGADVALGVTAYQIAASAQAAAASAKRGQTLTREVAREVAEALDEAVEEVRDVAAHSRELARHSTRGALHAGDDLADEVGRVARGAVLGTLRALAERSAETGEILRGAGYGAVQGALEAGSDPAYAAAHAIAAARDLAPELGVEASEAASALAEGMLDAAAASGAEALAAVRRSLPPDAAAGPDRGAPGD